MSKPVTIIYPMHNRLEYTKLTLPQLIFDAIRSENIVEQLRIYDDESTDGSSEFVQALVKTFDKAININYVRKKIGNSTYQINDSYKKTKSEYLLKVDNDILVPSGYVKTLHWLMDKHPSIGFLMMPEVGDFPFIKDKSQLSLKDRSHIGGVGAFRRDIFEKQGDIKTGKKFFGFTAFQNKAKKELNLRTCELVGSGNMNLDASRVYSRVKYYEKMGWGRNMWKGVQSILDMR